MIVNSKKFKGRHEFNVKTRISIKIGSKKKTSIASKKERISIFKGKTKVGFLID
jgi:hypothetical protein